jgi:hypothetical protein
MPSKFDNFDTIVTTIRSVSFEVTHFLVLDRKRTQVAVFFITRRVSEGLVMHIATAT